MSGRRAAVDPARVFPLNDRPAGPGPVICWMSRDQRVADNWALLYAQQLALERRSPLAVVFCLASRFPGATLRAYAFMLDGLRQVEPRLLAKAIPFFLLQGEPAQQVPRFLGQCRAGILVTDFDPLRIKREWKRQVARRVNVPLLEVDAHNIVPCRHASPRQEYGAYTLRPKLRRLLPRFLVAFPPLLKHPHAWRGAVPAVAWASAAGALRADPSVGAVDWLQAGEAAALRKLRTFAGSALARYDRGSNNPAADGQSQLSPYLHFGQISAQRVALEVDRAEAPRAARDAFLEQLIVRRELADNFCFYSPDYDTPRCFPRWAQATLAGHGRDPRPYRYGRAELEAARTHDPLWNAAHTEMVGRGKMHGYLRMYWAKKILEWTSSADEAMEIAVGLNDRYELDGRDPNGYTGIAWSLGGVHDRPWPERPVFGQIRYMSYNGCRTKFSIGDYMRRVRQGQPHADGSSADRPLDGY